MESEHGGESTSTYSASASSNEAADFECNICFDLAQDPVVTLCGHLFCWPCLYKWLHLHSHSQECPVCKALVIEEKLVPLYGRGKTSPTDPRSRPIPGINIPNRPTGERPETAPAPDPNRFAQNAFGMMGGSLPMASARLGNFVFSTAFGGLFPPLFNIQVHSFFNNQPAYGAAPAYPYGFHHPFNGGHAHGIPLPTNRRQQADNHLKNLLLMIGIFVILALLIF